MSPSPDPDRPPDPDLKIREIFRAAAEKSTGPGKPYFERLNKAVNGYQAAADTGNVVKFQRAEREFKAAMRDVKLFAKTDPETAKILIEVSDAISQISAEEKDKAAAPPPPPPPKKKPVKVWRF